MALSVLTTVGEVALRPDEEMVALIKEIRQTTGEKAHPSAGLSMSRDQNQIPYDFFRSRPDIDWSIFHTVFTSHEHNMYLSTLGSSSAFQLKRKGRFEPHDTVFVGHDSDDVVTTCSFGMHGALFADFKEDGRELRSIVGDPVKRGREYLHANARKLACDAGSWGTLVSD